MFGKLLGSVISAPLRAVEVAVGAVDRVIDCDALDIERKAREAAEATKKSVEYICDGDN